MFSCMGLAACVEAPGMILLGYATLVLATSHNNSASEVPHSRDATVILTESQDEISPAALMFVCSSAAMHQQTGALLSCPLMGLMTGQSCILFLAGVRQLLLVALCRPYAV